MKLKQYIERNDMKTNGIHCVIIIGSDGDVIGAGKNYKDAAVVAYEHWAGGYDKNDTFILSEYDGRNFISKKYFYAEDMELR